MPLSKLSIVFIFILLALFLGCSDSSTNNNQDINQPPAAPSNPSPAIGETGVSRTPRFGWSCSDTDSDTLYYTLRFRPDSAITASDAIAGPLINNYYDFSIYSLAYNTTYFWQIAAEDNDGNTTVGPVWNFTTLPQDSTYVTIPDTSFRRAIVSHLNGVTELDSIYVFQVDTITALNNIGGYVFSGSYHIESIAGIEEFDALKTMYIFYVPLSDISPLTNLTNLEVVYLMNDQITNIAPLANHSSLRTLTLSGNPISDISTIQTLTGLTTLFLDSVSLTSIADLANVTSLQTLYIRNNDITDISPLANLTQLHILYLEHNQITDITPLQNLTLLETLVLDYNMIDTIPSLSNLTNLKKLYASYDNIEDISNLSEMTWLTEIYLINNSIVDITALQGLDSLRNVNLTNNQVVDIKPLVDNSGITYGDQVWLTNNPLSDSSINVYIPELEARGVSVYY